MSDQVVMPVGTVLATVEPVAKMEAELLALRKETDRLRTALNEERELHYRIHQNALIAEHLASVQSRTLRDDLVTARRERDDARRERDELDSEIRGMIDTDQLALNEAREALREAVELAGTLLSELDRSVGPLRLTLAEYREQLTALRKRGGIDDGGGA